MNIFQTRLKKCGMFFFLVKKMLTTDSVINEALEAVEIARNQLNNCDSDMLESAIFKLSSAESKLNALLARRRLG